MPITHPSRITRVFAGVCWWQGCSCWSALVCWRRASISCRWSGTTIFILVPRTTASPCCRWCPTVAPSSIEMAPCLRATTPPTRWKSRPRVRVGWRTPSIDWPRSSPSSHETGAISENFSTKAAISRVCRYVHG
ncbi:hypothetical protein SDC9_121809 [bioreactor metagenome]|uniref:Uncharacterized protein n=1 Tax=bioreactor metagenome TaxID=1076179 RepID=A0A645CD23_9ZZZZ